jgi:hypothetical protein
MKSTLSTLALAAALTLGTATGTADAASSIGSSSPSPPVPAGYYQGWYSQYIVTWNGGLNTGTYSIQIVTTYVSGATYQECATTLSSAMSHVRYYQWASCVQML